MGCDSQPSSSPLDSLTPFLPERVATSDVPSLADHRSKFFRCNTYGLSRRCCKQKTYAKAKPFRCNTYKKPRGTFFKPRAFLFLHWALFNSSRHLFTFAVASSPIFRTFFQDTYTASPLFATLTKTPGVWGYSSHSGTRHSPLITRHFHCYRSALRIPDHAAKENHALL
jgi:hypothetical protein